MPFLSEQRGSAFNFLGSAQGEIALAEICARRLGLASERDDVDEAELLSLLVLLAVAPIDRQTERCHRRALRGVTEFRISRDIPEQRDRIQARHN